MRAPCIVVAVLALPISLPPMAAAADDPTTPTEGERLLEAARADLNGGRVADAVATLERVLKAAPKLWAADCTSQADLLFALAYAYAKQERFEKAEDHYRGALRVAEKAYGPDHLTTTAIRRRLALTVREAGKDTEAEPLLEAARKALVKAGREDDEDTAEVQDALAWVLVGRKDFAAAEALARRAIQGRVKRYEAGGETRWPETRPPLAASMYLLGVIARDARQRVEADAHFMNALGFSTGLGDDSLYAAVMRAWASNDLQMGAIGTAEERYMKALGLIEAKRGKDHIAVADCLDDLAAFYVEIQKFDEVAPLARRALAIRTAKFGPDHPAVAKSLHTLAVFHAQKKEFDKAEPLHLQALAIRRASLGDDHADTVRSLHDLAETAFRLGKWDDALKYRDQARRAFRTYAAGRLGFMSAAQRGRYLRDTDARDFDLALAHALARKDQPGVAARSAEWALNRKGLGHELAATDVRLARQASTMERFDALRDLKDVREQLARMAVRNFNPDYQLGDKMDLDALLNRERQCIGRLRELTGSAGGDTTWVDVPAVQLRLGRDAAFIDLEDVNQSVVAWVVTGDAEPRLVDLGDRILAAVAEVRRQLAAAAARIQEAGEPDAERDLRAALRAVAALVIDPLLPLIGDKTEWVVCPNKFLAAVPWAALPLADGAYAVEKYRIRYAVSGRDLIAPPPTDVKPTAPAVFADPDFDLGNTPAAPPTEAAVSRGLPRDFKLPPARRLPGTAAEAEAVRPALQRWLGQEPQMFLDRDATRARARALRSPRALMFCTHGFFLDNPTGLYAQTPLARCGLLLAGCNRRDETDHGVLTGAEVLDLDLRGCELVVLSACETGVGDWLFSLEEGIVGLTQAFQLAGADCVVASQWQVPDRETATLMVRLFDGLAAKTGKAEALRQAQLAAVAARRKRNAAAHPYYWAAFTLTGRD